jgi:uncharacterized protein (DUF1501 family)
MNRRDFLGLAGLGGLTLVAGGLASSREARADTPSTGPLFLLVHAAGGWDPTSFCDPKGCADPKDPKRVNNYLAKDIGQAGSIRYAPVANNAAFFQKHHAKLCVVNGVDTATNSHDVGTRHTWSGSLLEHRPSFGALVAGAKAPTAPLGFITNGGYDETAGVVPLTRVGNLDAVRRIAFPNVVWPGGAPDQFHTDATAQRIAEARRARLEAQAAKQTLPREQAARAMLVTARAGQGDLKRLTDFLPKELEKQSLKAQVQVAMAAYRAGICVAANLVLGGFDTHGNHDDTHHQRLADLTDGLDFLLAEIDKYPETAGNVVCVVGSDFGRTPYYNTGNGKDHWSITSVVAFGKGIPGDRVVGGTTDGFEPRTVDPKTLAPSEAGVRIKPGHVQKALRKVAGISASPVVKPFAVAEAEELALFG